MSVTTNQVEFNFEKGDGLEALEKLEGILCSSHWSDRGLNYEDERTVLLIRLLRLNGLVVFEHRHPSEHEYTEELIQQARSLTNLFRKRNMDCSMFSLARLFHDHEPDYETREHNALYYPGLNAYIRCGGLDAEGLFDLLAYEDCTKVLIFPSECISNTEYAFYTIACVMPKPELFEMLEKLREQRLQELFAIQHRVNELHGNIFPPPPSDVDSKTE